MSDDLAYTSATDLLTAYRAKTLSPVEATEAALTRIAAHDELLNAYLLIDHEGALAAARKSEARWARGEPRGLVDGVPTSIKDVLLTQGWPTLRGSKTVDADQPWEDDAPSVARMRDHGAVFLGKTTTPEFGHKGVTDSPLTGITRNPWNTERTSGGSSGGASSAVAAGMGPLAFGTDAGGSIRIPAGFTGVFGHKPSFGRVPAWPASPFSTLAHVGPMTRTVADAALMANVMAGPHPLDHASLPKKLTLPLDAPGIAGMRIAYSIDLGHYEVIDDVRRETMAALAALTEAGAEVTEVALPGASEAIRLAHAAPEFLFAPAIQDAVEKHGDVVSAYVPELAATATSVPADDYRRSLSYAGAFWHDCLGPILKAHDAFICPAVSCPEVPAENWQQTPVMVRGRSLTDTDTAMTALFNMFSRCPVLSVPSGMTDAGLPTGLQIVGRACDDPTVFRVARALEQRRPWLDVTERRPGIAAGP